jgi:UDP:flavonoid glycosyltransferase YjiC (YdhE family)
MARCLLALWAGGGNVPPQLLVAKRLARAGHQVEVYAPAVLREPIERAGAAYVPYRRAPEHDSSRPDADLIRDWEVRGLAAAARSRDRLLYGTAESIARDLLDRIAAQPPDVLLTDYMLLGAYVAGERAGLPTVGLIHSVYPLPAPGLPPRSTGWLPPRGPVARVGSWLLGRLVVRFFDAPLSRLNRLRGELGLAPIRSVLDLLVSATRMLVLTIAALDFPARLPTNVRYVGFPSDPDLPSPVLSQPPHAGAPLVLVSLSTTFQDQTPLLHRLLGALDGLPVRALVTLGPAVQATALQPPPNVDVVAWLPHHEVLPKTDLVVTHGGHGTVASALRYGVAVLCLPMGRDQLDVAARVRWRHAGLVGSADAAVPELRGLIARGVHDATLHDGARQIATAMARDDPDAAVREITAVACWRP